MFGVPHPDMIRTQDSGSLPLSPVAFRKSWKPPTRSPFADLPSRLIGQNWVTCTSLSQSLRRGVASPCRS